LNCSRKRIDLVHLIYRTPLAEVKQLLEKVRDADYAILVTHQFDARLADIEVIEVRPGAP